MVKYFSAQEPIFKTAPMFVLGCDFDTFKPWMMKQWNCDVGDFTVGQSGSMFTMHNGRKVMRVVWTNTIDPGPCLHETFHLVTRICHDKGVQIRAKNERGEWDDETGAYLMEFFGRKVVEHLAKRVRKQQRISLDLGLARQRKSRARQKGPR